MKISALKKLLHLIKSSDSQELTSLSEEISEQSPPESEMPDEETQENEMQNSECEIQDDEITVTHTESNRSHLTSSVPRAASAPFGAISKGELAEIRAIFEHLDDGEIQRLYKKVTK